MNRSLLTVMVLLISAILLSGCSSSLPQLETVDEVNLDRFMGDWYVIAFIPIFAEKHATNAIEHYDLREDGDVDITYTFFNKSPDGRRKEFRARGFIPEDGTGAEWRVQFFWPLRFHFLVIDLAEDYSHTVIGVPNRRYLWIMAREPGIDENTYSGILDRLEQQHYDISQVKRVLQTWGEEKVSKEDGQ